MLPFVLVIYIARPTKIKHIKDSVLLPRKMQEFLTGEGDETWEIKCTETINGTVN